MTRIVGMIIEARYFAYRIRLRCVVMRPLHQFDFPKGAGFTRIPKEFTNASTAEYMRNILRTSVAQYCRGFGRVRIETTAALKSGAQAGTNEIDTAADDLSHRCKGRR